jgi:hypothetical protein
MDRLFGGAGGNEEMLAAISDSYGGQIAALEGWGNELAGLTQGLIGNINASADATNQQIGSYYDYAAHQANAGRPVIAETGQAAMGNVDEIYNTLATNLAAIPGSAVDRASSAAGSAVGGSVAGRVAASVAPFQAAGETSRANTQANLTQHSAAGQDYLSQLAAAAPSDAAMRQASVAGRANNAVTEAEMALAQQRAQIAAQTAALEGAEQRALIEASADTAGTTFDRIMQTVSLGNALGADMSGMASDLGFTPDGPEPRDPRDVLAEIELDDALQPAGYTDFRRAADQADPATSDMAWTLFNMAESQGMDVPGVMQIIDQFTNEPEREVEQERSPFNPLRWFGADTYTETEGGGTAESLDDLFIEGPDGTLMINPEQSLFTEANQAPLRELMRIAFS